MSRNHGQGLTRRDGPAASYRAGRRRGDRLPVRRHRHYLVRGRHPRRSGVYACITAEHARIGRDGTEFFNETIPFGRHDTPDEIARSILYLASEQSSFTTGSMLMVDGGTST